MQKVIIAFFYTDQKPHPSVLDINDHLERGWRVAQATPMGGGVAGSPGSSTIAFASMVVLEKEEA